jgi:hypothetical protein
MPFLKKSVFVFLVVLFYVLKSQTAWASCGACYVPRTSSGELGEEGSIASGPMVYSPTASTLGKHRLAAGFTLDYLKYQPHESHLAHRLHHQGHDVHGKFHEEIYDIHFGFGVLEFLDLYLSVPIVSKTHLQVEDHDRLGQKESFSGFGDMRLITKYRFWNKGVQAAFVGGVKFPTGQTSRLDKSGNAFEPEQAPGTGSWDGDFGIAISRSFRQRLSLATSFQYVLRGEGSQEHKIGDVFQYNIGVSWVFWKRLGQYPNASLVMELNNRWGMKDHTTTEDSLEDSGGTVILLTPGLQTQLNKNVSAFWAMPLPVYQHPGGEHERLRFEMLTGVSWLFG